MDTEVPYNKYAFLADRPVLEKAVDAVLIEAAYKIRALGEMAPDAGIGDTSTDEAITSVFFDELHFECLSRPEAADEEIPAWYAEQAKAYDRVYEVLNKHRSEHYDPAEGCVINELVRYIIQNKRKYDRKPTGGSNEAV